MTNVFRAQLLRLVRRRTVVAGIVGAILFAALSSLTVLSSAEPGAAVSRQGGTSLAAVAGHGGGTEAFAVGASFTGFLVFVTFIGLMSVEFSGGTFRTLLLREPRRLHVIAGTFAAALVVVAVFVALCELVTFAGSWLVAPTQDIPTGEWLTATSVADGIRDYVTAMAGITGWAVFGTALAVVFRSAPLALGVGFAWAGPFENIVVDSWSTGFRVFPGQVLGSLIRGGTVELGMGRAVATATVYVAVAAAVALVLVTKRDVTA